MNEKIRYFTLPNFFTLMNLIAGSLAVIFASDLIIDKLYIASYLVLIALFFDFFDGFLARATNTVSKFGKELDSLADLVSFGVAPALITFQMIKMALDINAITFDLPIEQLLMLSSPILLIVAGFLRLAKFNVSEKQNKKFLGLAIPASAVFFVSFAILNTLDTSKSYEFIVIKLFNEGSSPLKLDLAVIGMYVYLFPKVWLYLISIFVFAFLQLVNIPMFSLKFEGFSFRKNAIRYIFISLALLMLIVLQAIALPLVVLLYIVISIFDDIISIFIKSKVIPKGN